jgi:hypothetical protein
METEQTAEQVEQQVEAALESEPTAASGRPAEAADDPARLARIERLLERVVEHLYQVRREEQAREFGLMEIFAALALVIAIGAMLGAVLALLKTQVDRGLAALSLLGAIAMQGLALTLFMLRRRD